MLVADSITQGHRKDFWSGLAVIDARKARVHCVSYPIIAISLQPWRGGNYPFLRMLGR